MFLRVRLAALGRGERVDPSEDLRDGLDLQEVQLEARTHVSEASAEGFVRVVQVDGLCAEAAHDFALGQRVERDAVTSLSGGDMRHAGEQHREREKKQKQSGRAFPVHKKLLYEMGRPTDSARAVGARRARRAREVS